MLLFSAAITLFDPCAIAQSTTTGSVTVTVTDPSGAPVPNAQLEITDTSTNVLQKASTGTTGAYTFPSLTFGTYQLTVTAAGFQTELYSAVQVVTSLNTDIHAALKLGATAETVTVSTSEVPLVELESSTLADSIDTKQVTSLPLQGRNMFALSFLIPGWSSTAPGSSGGTWDNMPGGAIVSADFDGTQAISNPRDATDTDGMYPMNLVSRAPIAAITTYAKICRNWPGPEQGPASRPTLL